jgi:DNA-binding NarL/FixJ family response regulator
VNFIKGDVRLEVIVAIVAFIFFFVGLYFNYQSERREGRGNPEDTALVGSKANPSAGPDEARIKMLGLTPREYEVLVKMSEGLSNQEIGAALFLSESTIKTHVSNILFKLDAKRRTQAVQFAKQLKIVP